MTERPEADTRRAPGGLHFQISKLLVIAITVATAATGALIVSMLIEWPSASPPPGPNGMPPPPPNMQPLAVFSVVTGFFVLSWLAVLVIFSRDQILLYLREQQQAGPVDPQALDVLLAGQRAELRAELAADHERDLRALTDRLAEMTAEYGERRETDGYLNGMRAATMNESPEANVRSLRRTPPPR
jgi:hypothetical protein